MTGHTTDRPGEDQSDDPRIDILEALLRETAHTTTQGNILLAAFTTPHIPDELVHRARDRVDMSPPTPSGTSTPSDTSGGWWDDRECVCGSTIPADPSTDWEPQCRHCERIWVSRGFIAATDPQHPDPVDTESDSD